MGILLITTIIFLIPSNTIATVFAQSSYPPAGCAHTLYISITNLPKQTDFSSMAVPMVNTGPGVDHAEANYPIPGIGTAHLTIDYKAQPQASYYVQVSGLPGQTGPSDIFPQFGVNVCQGNQGNGVHADAPIPGIGDGFINMNAGCQDPNFPCN